MITELLVVLANKGYGHCTSNTKVVSGYPIHIHIVFSTLAGGLGDIVDLNIIGGIYTLQSKVLGDNGKERVWEGDTETQLLTLIKNEL